MRTVSRENKSQDEPVRTSLRESSRTAHIGTGRVEVESGNASTTGANRWLWVPGREREAGIDKLGRSVLRLDLRFKRGFLTREVNLKSGSLDGFVHLELRAGVCAERPTALGLVVVYRERASVDANRAGGTWRCGA